MNYEETPQYYEKYEQHRTFADVTALNEAVRLHLYYNGESLNKTDAAVFKLLSRFSCVVPGVSWMKVATMAGHAEKSEKTIRRALRKLEDLGMIRRVPTIHEKGGRGHDICIILNESIATTCEGGILADDHNMVSRADHVAFNARRFDDDEATDQAESQKVTAGAVAEMSTRSKPQEVPEHKETAINKSNTYVRGTSYLPDYIPASFARLCAGLGNDRLTVKLWHKVTLAHGHSTLNGRIEDVLDTVERTLKGALYKAKHGQIKRTLAGYFYRGLYQRLIEEKRRETGGVLPFNWLEEGAEKDVV